MSKTVEHEELIEANLEAAALLNFDSATLAEHVGYLKEQWGNDTFYAEVDGVMYRIAPVDGSL